MPFEVWRFGRHPRGLNETDPNISLSRLAHTIYELSYIGISNGNISCSHYKQQKTLYLTTSNKSLSLLALSFKYLDLEVPSNDRWNECATRHLFFFMGWKYGVVASLNPKT